MKICAGSPTQPEFTLCGDAFDLDATDTGEDEFEPFRFARIGETVTCEHCRRVIHEVRDNFPRGYKRKA